MREKQAADIFPNHGPGGGRVPECCWVQVVTMRGTCNSRHTFSGHQHQQYEVWAKKRGALALAFAQATKPKRHCDCRYARRRPAPYAEHVPFGNATVRQRTNLCVCIEAIIKEPAAHENPHDEQAAGVRAASAEQIRIVETLPAFPEDVCTELAADALVIRRLRKDIDSENWVAQCAAALHEVQHRKKRHAAIAWEQKRLSHR